jgi:hypothetical protein
MLFVFSVSEDTRVFLGAQMLPSHCRQVPLPLAEELSCRCPVGTLIQIYHQDSLFGNRLGSVILAL